VTQFNNSFIDTSRITVELAHPVGDEHTPRPWSKYSEGSSRFNEINKKQENLPIKRKEISGKQEDKNDPKLQKFLNVVGKRSKSVWRNNDAELLDKVKQEKKVSLVESRRTGGKGFMLEKTHIKFEDENDENEEIEKEEDDDMYQDVPPSLKEEVIQSQQNLLANNPEVSNIDYLRSKMRKNFGDDSDESDEEQAQEEDVEEEMEEEIEKRRNGRRKR